MKEGGRERGGRKGGRNEGRVKKERSEVKH